MNGLMKNFNIDESAKKDKQVQDFIKTVNPYATKPSLGIDLRSLAKYMKTNGKNATPVPEAILKQFAIK